MLGGNLDSVGGILSGVATHDERMKLLEEALVDCADWIRHSDIYDDNLAPETSWIQDGEILARPPLPGEYADAEALREKIERAQQLVERVESLFTPSQLEAARARSRTRRRMEKRRT